MTAQHQSHAILSPKSGTPPQATAGQTRRVPTQLQPPHRPGWCLVPSTFNATWLPRDGYEAWLLVKGAPVNDSSGSPPQQPSKRRLKKGSAVAQPRAAEDSRRATPRLAWGGVGGFCERDDHHFVCLQPAPPAQTPAAPLTKKSELVESRGPGEAGCNPRPAAPAKGGWSPACEDPCSAQGDPGAKSPAGRKRTPTACNGTPQGCGRTLPCPGPGRREPRDRAGQGKPPPGKPAGGQPPGARQGSTDGDAGEASTSPP